jgi:hypothetical protein
MTSGRFIADWSNRVCTPGMGVNLWGASPLYVNPNIVVRRGKQVLAAGKGVSARRGPKEAGAQSYEPTNRNGIQGHYPGKSAHHDEVPRIQEKW